MDRHQLTHFERSFLDMASERAALLAEEAQRKGQEAQAVIQKAQATVASEAFKRLNLPDTRKIARWIPDGDQFGAFELAPDTKQEKCPHGHAP